jgi:DNA-binding transcriptional LysR family regulator
MHDLNDMRYFAQVIAEGSFTAAARKLEIPKSTLSRRIAQLEERLGVRLLMRSTRRLTLTDIGREFLVHCETVVAGAEAAHNTIEHVRQAPRGTVRLTAPMDVCRAMLAPALPAFMTAYPEVTVKLDALNRRVDLVEEGVDIAVRVRPAIEDSSLVMRSIAASPVLLVAAPKLLERLGDPSDISALEGYPSLSMALADGRYRWSLRKADGETVVVHHHPRLITDDMLVLREAAIAGIGIVTLPGFVCHSALGDKRLRVVHPDWHLPDGQIHIVYQHRRGLLPAVRALAEFLAVRLPEFAQRVIVPTGTCGGQDNAASAKSRSGRRRPDS